MNFTLFSGGAVLGGLLVLAAGLYLLQRLRVRYRPLTVETTIFWKEALEESRARVLVKRFRHPWAYALLLAIVGLIWLALGGPEFGAGRDRRHLILIDGSKAMAAGGRFDAAVALVEDELRSLPSGSRSVVLCADRPRTLLLPDENPLLLRARLADFRPTDSVARFEEVAASYARVADREPLALVIVGDSEIDAGFEARLPAGSSLRRLSPPGAVARARLLDFGQGPAASGLYDRVDALVAVSLPEDRRPAIETLLDGRGVEVPAGDYADGVLRITLADLPATGGTLELRLAKEVVGRLVLSDHRPIAVGLEPDLPEVLGRVLAADPGLSIDSQRPELIVRRAGSGFGGDLPALEIGPMAARAETFFFQHDEGDDSGRLLARLVDELGLARLDGPALAEQLESTVRVAAAPGASRALAIWSELLDDESGFTTTAEFPVFVGRALRWLAGREEAPERVAVGEPLALGPGPIESPRGSRSVTLGDSYTPLRTGRHLDADGRAVEASVLAPGLAGGAARLTTSDEAGGGGLDAFELILLLALSLLIVEWFLLKTGRIP